MTEILIKLTIPDGFGPAGIQYLINKAIRSLDIQANVESIFDNAADFANAREAFTAAYQREIIQNMAGGGKR